MANYKPVEKDQGYFLDIIPSDHFKEDSIEKVINRFIDEEVDFRSFSDKYNNDYVGQKAIHPSIKLKAIIYSYVNGIETSREMEAMMNKKHLGYVYLTGNRTLDHTTICKFINEFSDEINSILGKLLMLMNELGLIDWGKIVIDGTRISSNASKELTSDALGFKEKMRRYMNLSEKLLERTRILEEDIEEGNISKERSVKEKNNIDRQRKLYNNIIDKIKGYEDDLVEGKIDPKDKVNLTDRESKLLKDQEGFKQGYNVQVAYSDNDIIVDIDASHSAGDNIILKETVDRVERRKDELGVDKDSKYLHDKGYYNPGQIMELERSGIDMYVAIPDNIKNSWALTGKHEIEFSNDEVYFICSEGRKRKGHYEEKESEYVFTVTREHCAGCDKFQECWKNIKGDGNRRKFKVTGTYAENKRFWNKYVQKMSSKEGLAIYNKRIGKEHNFHDLKSYEGLRWLKRRGRQKCNTEAIIAAIAHNLKKYQKILSIKVIEAANMA